MRSSIPRGIGVLCLFFFLSAFSGKEELVFSKKFKEYPFIPSGTFIPLPEDSKTQASDPKALSVQGFYMSEKEVSNAEYQRFLDDLVKEGRVNDLAEAKIRNENWRKDLSNMEPYVKLYHFHAAYKNYPVINVTFEGANLYCAWLTEELHKQFPGEYDNYAFRLPQKVEFMYAAQGGHDLAPYAWGGYYLRNAKGQLLANFDPVGSESIRRNSETGALELIDKPKAAEPNNYAFGPAPSTSLFPNDYGLYNMCGNVAEMTAEKGVAMGGSWNSPGFDIRVYSESRYEKPNPEVGFRPVLAVNE